MLALRIFRQCHILAYLIPWWFFGSKWNLVADAHTLGLHGLSGANPAGDPVLPEIEGPFEVELKVRFSDDTTDAFHTLFEWTDASEDNMIWFGQHTSSGNGGGAGVNEARITVGVNGLRTECLGNNTLPVNAGELITFKFGVDASNTARIFQDGSLVAECPNRPIPLNVPRTHRLGTGLSEAQPGVERLKGAILGFRLTNLNSGAPQDPGSAFAFMNFPSQTFASPFVASFYARWDNLQNGRGYQRAFDFGNGEANNNILCSQFRDTATLICQVYVGATRYRITAADAIVEGEFAFWHFGVSYNSTSALWRFWIEKDGALLKEQNESLTIPKVFRKNLLLGASNWDNDVDLDGVVLGFHLDRGGQIS